RPRILLQHRTDENNFALGIFVHAACRDCNRLSFTDCRKVSGTYREFDPALFEVHDHKKLGLKAVPPASSTELYLAFDDPTSNRRTNVVTAKRSFGLIWQGGNLAVIEA